MMEQSETKRIGFSEGVLGSKHTKRFAARPQRHHFQYAQNGGDFTLDPPDIEGSVFLEMTNTDTAGSISFGPWSRIIGADQLTQTPGAKFLICMTRVGDFSHIEVVAGAENYAGGKS